MIIGTVRETKDGEHRVGLTPEGVSALVESHTVLFEPGAGEGSGFSDAAYEAAGAIRAPAAEIWGSSGLLVKVKEPQPSEFGLLNARTVLFTYLHLSANRALANALEQNGSQALAYELVRDRSGALPLLTPMSEVAGRMAALTATHLLMKPGPGRGKLAGGVAGAPPARALVVGAGTVGASAARALAALGARTTVVSRGLGGLRAVQRDLGAGVVTRVSTPEALRQEFAGADIAVLGVLQPGQMAPRIVTREMVRSMGAGAVVVDVSIDEGGASQTSRPTSHSAPTYLDEGVIHYCVPNMPGAVPATSTVALTSATLPYIQALADKGLEGALHADPGLAAGRVG
jgi:alanine dehydrogenase